MMIEILQVSENLFNALSLISAKLCLNLWSTVSNDGHSTSYSSAKVAKISLKFGVVQDIVRDPACFRPIMAHRILLRVLMK
jgi:hypothetical protein